MNKSTWQSQKYAAPLLFTVIVAMLMGVCHSSLCLATQAFRQVEPSVETSDKTKDSASSSIYQELHRFKKDGRLYLTLDDCLLLALERNFDIRLAEEALVQADADFAQSKAAMLPVLDAESSYTRLDEELSFSMGPQSLTFMNNNLYKAGIVVRQPIFMGGRLKSARKAAQYSRDARNQDKLSIEAEMIFQVTRAYRTVQVAEAFEKVAMEAVGLLETHEHDVSILVETGANPEIDLLRTRTELANARKELNSAENTLDLARSFLKNLLNIDLKEPLSLTEKLRRPQQPAGDLSAFTQLAISKRPELMAMKSQIHAAEQGLSAAKGEYLPSIVLEGRYEYIDGDIRDLEGGFHWTIGIGAHIPIWNWGKTAARVGRAQSQLTQIKISLQKLEDQIRLETRRAFLNLGKSEKNIEATQIALKSATEAYRHARVRYRAGEGTNTEVLDARTAFSRAEANHTQSLYEYNLALASIQRAIGATVNAPKDFGKREFNK